MSQTKEHGDIWGSKGRVHRRDCGDGFMSIHITYNLLNCTFQIGAVYCMSIIPQYSCKTNKEKIESSYVSIYQTY